MHEGVFDVLVSTKSDMFADACRDNHQMCLLYRVRFRGLFCVRVAAEAKQITWMGLTSSQNSSSFSPGLFLCGLLYGLQGSSQIGDRPHKVPARESGCLHATREKGRGGPGGDWGKFIWWGRRDAGRGSERWGEGGKNRDGAGKPPRHIVRTCSTHVSQARSHNTSVSPGRRSPKSPRLDT